MLHEVVQAMDRGPTRDLLDPAYAQFRDQTRFWVQRVAVPLIMVIGLFGNLVTIIIMTRRRMRSTTNMYLAALAFVDMLYLVLTFLLGLSHYPNMAERKYYAYWKLRSFLMMLTDACSNTSVWLTVTFTIERFIAVKYPMKGKIWCTEARAKKLIILVFIFGLIFASPVPFEWKVIEKRVVPKAAATAQKPITLQTETAPIEGEIGVIDESTVRSTDSIIFTNNHTSDVSSSSGSSTEEKQHMKPHLQQKQQDFPPDANFEQILTNQTSNGVPIEGDRQGEINDSYVLALDYTDFGRNETYKTIYYWSTAVLFCFIPLISLTLFNGFLIKSVHHSQRERNKMTGQQQLIKKQPSTAVAAAAATTAAAAAVVAADKKRSRLRMARQVPAGVPGKVDILVNGRSKSSSNLAIGTTIEQTKKVSSTARLGELKLLLLSPNYYINKSVLATSLGVSPTLVDAQDGVNTIVNLFSADNGGHGSATVIKSSEGSWDSRKEIDDTEGTASGDDAPFASSPESKTGSGGCASMTATRFNPGEAKTQTSDVISATMSNIQSKGDNLRKGTEMNEANLEGALTLATIQAHKAGSTAKEDASIDFLPTVSSLRDIGGMKKIGNNAAGGNGSISTNSVSTSIQSTAPIVSTQERRITIMLIAVVILFLVCQIPTAAMLIYTSLTDTQPNTNEHALLLAFGNVFNFLMAVNAAGNFILYSFLSKKYRRTFVILFCNCLRPTRSNKPPLVVQVAATAANQQQTLPNICNQNRSLSVRFDKQCQVEDNNRVATCQTGRSGSRARRDTLV